MSFPLEPVARVFGHNTWIFANAVKDVPADKESLTLEGTNSFVRVAGHVTVCRHAVCGMVQGKIEPLPWGSFAEFDIGAQFKADHEAPSLAEIVKEWEAASQVLTSGLGSVSAETLLAPSPLPIPGDHPTVGDLISFMAMHESYHIGQLGMLKKAMSGNAIMQPPK